jgi:uncharacterized protein YaaQ
MGLPAKQLPGLYSAAGSNPVLPARERPPIRWAFLMKEYPMSDQKVDRLMLLVVSGTQAGNLVKDLQQERFYFTVIDTSGGVVNEQVVCLLRGLPEQRLPVLLELVRKNCQTYRQYITAQMRAPGDFLTLPMVEAQMGGAVVYLMNVDRFEQF